MLNLGVGVCGYCGLLGYTYRDYTGLVFTSLGFFLYKGVSLVGYLVSKFVIT